MYVGLSASKCDELVADGRMPPAPVIDRRKVWDIRAFDAAFNELPYENGPAADNITVAFSALRLVPFVFARQEKCETAGASLRRIPGETR
jgi:hypothetical protein